MSKQGIMHYLFCAAFAIGIMFIWSKGTQLQLEDAKNDFIKSRKNETIWFPLITFIAALILGKGFGISLLIWIGSQIPFSIRLYWHLRMFNDGTHPWYSVHSEVSGRNGK